MRREFSAGGVAVRSFRGRPFVAVIRTKKAALALPKGHPERGEGALEAALREVREETGIDAAPVGELGEISYWYAKKGERRLKTVAFFLLRYRSGSVRDHDDEVESAAWIPLEDAPRLLSYPSEREIAVAALSSLQASR